MKIIYTNHALERIKQRRLSQDDILLAITQPDRKFSQDKNDEVKFIKTVHGRRYQVVAKFLADQNAWLVVSAWVRGEEDPEPILFTILVAPFRLLGEVIKYFWQRRRVRKKNKNKP